MMLLELCNLLINSILYFYKNKGVVCDYMCMLYTFNEFYQLLSSSSINVSALELSKRAGPALKGQALKGQG